MDPTPVQCFARPSTCTPLPSTPNGRLLCVAFRGNRHLTGQSNTFDLQDSFSKLRNVLLNAPPANLERLAGCLLGRLLGVPVRIPRAGDQRGGDGGVAGAGGRHLIFEARRYKEGSRLDERSIVGEIQQAVNRNPALEAWILVTTLEVSEQVETAIIDSAQKNGIGAIIIDWLPQPLPKLAVLSARYPECFETEIGEGNGPLLANIAAAHGYDCTLQAIKSELDIWTIGYESVRQASHARVREIWGSSRKASAKFGQNVAGGEEGAHYVRRSDLTEYLDAWSEAAGSGRVGALIGPDGVGKTWAAIDWLQLRLDRLPTVVLAPTSAIGDGISGVSDLISFIARYLRDLTEMRTESFWEQRVRRLLQRPVDEGPAFLLFFDGLNQRASFDWPGVFMQLQGEPFHQRTWTLMSARTSFFDERLTGLHMLIAKPERIEVGRYDLSHGGTFDQKLKLAGLLREDLSEGLLKHAAVPRLFDLVVQLKDSLGDAREVTVHRLLWAYGASTIVTSTDGAFSEHGWRRFILELAEEHRDGNRKSTVRRVIDLSDDPTLTPDGIYKRVSGVIDGIFTDLSGDDELAFEPELVHHALGLALVKQMESAQSEEKAIDLLEKFLDPIQGYDERAEILRAAVSIILERRVSRQPKWLSTLCTFWIHTQNLPDIHSEELAILAPELISPLLDVIEASDGHALRTPRYIAINALAAVDKGDPRVSRRIAERGAQWHRTISLEKRGTDSDRGENSPYSLRRKRLRERIGPTEAGTVTVSGREFEIVDQKGGDLIVAAAQLLQGRPLKDAISFFEAGAIHTAIVGGGSEHEPQAWLNVLNSVDPEETAEGLRRGSDTVRDRTPEPGVHTDLNKRIASLLLWRTGYADDAEKAWEQDPKIDHWLRYETDYLLNPSRSFFPLERRHVAPVLCNTDLSIISRIERTKDALLDPSFEVPSEFVDELILTGDEFDFIDTATGQYRTPGDLGWEHLSLALARCASDKLADLERKRMRSYKDRSVEQRLGTSLVVPSAMLLAGKDESAALRTLRELGKGGADDREYSTQTNILIAEIQCEPPVAQVQRIMESGLTDIDLFLARACYPPSESEIDELLSEYGSNEEQLTRLASILAEHDLTLSERAFLAFSGSLIPTDVDIKSGALWVLLALNDPARLGATLDAADWTWSSDRPFVENTMGSIAIATSNRGVIFAELAPRIAPGKLLYALSQKERSREEVELAVAMMTALLFRHPRDLHEPGIIISQEQAKAQSGRYDFSLGDVLVDNGNQNDSVHFLERMNNPERHAERRHQIIESYISKVEEARRTDAPFYLVHFKANDFDPVLKQCPEAVDSWLEGLDSMSVEFVRRARFAEGFFVALCEALLERNPTLGVSLWRALKSCLATKFVSHANIDRLTHALFAARPCAQVDAALEEIYAIDEARNDEELVNLVVAARSSGRIAWLQRMVSRDATSPCPAHRRRAVFLKPLLTRPNIAGDAHWPSGQVAGVFDSIHNTAWILGQRETFAAQWLRAFSEADTLQTAHANWLLFKACSDRRAWIWMRNIYECHATKDHRLEAAKKRFIDQEENNLKRAMANNEKSWADTLATRRYPKTLLPWNSKH